MSKKILIATPIHTDNLILQYVSSIFQIINNKNNDYEINVFWRRGSLVNKARNELIGYFLESHYDYIFFVDSDIVDFTNQFFSIVEEYLKIEKQIPLLMLGAIYPIKYFNFDYIQTSEQFKQNNWQQGMLKYNVNIDNLGINNQNIINEADENNGFVRASSIAGGFMMFSRHVVNKMIEKYPESAYRNFSNDKLVAKNNFNLFHSFVDPESKFYLSEDYGFCYNFNKIGGQIYANIKLELSHYGEQTFKGSLYDTLNIHNSQNKKNLILSNPRSGNHIIRTFIELLTELPTAGLKNVEVDKPIYQRIDFEMNIKNKNEYIYYKQHDLKLQEEPHYVTKSEEVNNLIFLLRNPIEIFLREDNINNEKNYVIPYKKSFREVYFDNLDFYHNHNGKKLLLYYEDIIKNPIQTIITLYRFLDINNEKNLSYSIENMSTILQKTKEVIKDTGGGHSSDLNHYSKQYKETLTENTKFIKEKLSLNSYYNTYLKRYICDGFF